MSDATPVVMSWSGGKDSCVALHILQQSPEWRVSHLLTTITRYYDRISMHGVRTELLDAQAAALGLPVDRVEIGIGASNDSYEAAMRAAIGRARAQGIETFAFGDLFLEDIRAYREAMLAPEKMRAIFPVWGRDTRQFAEDFIATGFRAVLVYVDPRVLDASFAGRLYDADLPPGVDPCGENGEFHTFVFDGPNFAAPIDIIIGERVIRDGFAFCDLIPAKA